MTGKKYKYTAEEKEQKRTDSIRERDEYISCHLGGFTQIFPLDKEHPRQIVYEKLLQMDGIIQTEPKKGKPS